MQMPNIPQLQISPILQVFRYSSDRPAQLRSKRHTALIIKAIARLDIDGIGPFKAFNVARVHARDYFMVRVREDFTGIKD